MASISDKARANVNCSMMVRKCSSLMYGLKNIWRIFHSTMYSSPLIAILSHRLFGSSFFRIKLKMYCSPLQKKTIRFPFAPSTSISVGSGVMSTEISAPPSICCEIAVEEFSTSMFSEIGVTTTSSITPALEKVFTNVSIPLLIETFGRLRYSLAFFL